MTNPRPDACRGCPLDEHPDTRGFVPPEGPTNSPLLFLGEAPGPDEAKVGRPFIGAAGSMLQRIFTLLGWSREQVRIANVLQCCPPNMWLEGAPWQFGSIQHCSTHRDPILAEPHQVIVPMGAVATKTVLDLLGAKKVKIQDFHGTINKDRFGRLIVPTFHPSFLQRGAHNLIGTVIWDLQQALAAAREGKPEDNSSLVIDPPIAWFRQWVDQVIAMRQQDPWAYPISSDIETPDKAGGKDESEITAEDRSFTILRVNVACHPDEGVTVPFVGPFIDELKRLHQSPGPIWGWNYTGYDFDRCVASDLLTPEDFPKVIDLMWFAHMLHSDLPRGLGFWAPFYSTFGPWKHLAESEPAKYGAIDGLQNHRVGFGVIKDLQRMGMWETALRHVHKLHYMALKPAQVVGVQIDRTRLLQFKSELTEKATVRLQRLQECFPDDLRNLTPKGGLTKRPLDNVLHVKATAFTRKGEKRAGKEQSEIKYDLYKQATIIEKEIEREVWVCQTCGAAEVQKRHRCTDKSLVPSLVLEVRTVQRYFWSEPFNPDSWQQVLAYIKYRKHQPGKAKKTHKESTDRETLERLTKTGDPFYKTLLDYRAIGKVRGTYVEGTERRLDAEDRVHPEPTFRPSTMRLSYVNPNITNVVSDRGGKDSLAAGFRKCVVAMPSTRLLEVDFSGIEAVEVGWFSRDPNYIRLAKLGVHAGLASHLLGRPYDPKWSDEEIGKYFKEIKRHEKVIYDRAKRCVHGDNYGLTEHGMVLQFPETFPTLKEAQKYKAAYRAMAPSVPKWQRQLRELAHKQKFLGGPGAHPFGYRHEFFSVFTYKKITQGQYWKILSLAKKKGFSEDDAPVAIINEQYFKVQLGEDGKRCLPPTTQVWMGDYTYKNLGDVKVGDIVIGWQRGMSARTKYYRKKPGPIFPTDTLCRTEVLAVHRTIDKTVTIRLASGRTIRCTRDHKWLACYRHTYEYLRADQLQVNDFICRIDVVDPGECPTHLRETAAWLGGFYDGEGCQNGITQAYIPGKGDLVDRAEEAFRRLGFSTTRQKRFDRKDRPTAWKDGTFLAWRGGRQEALRFARWVPSYRFKAQWADQMILSSRFRRLDRIVGIEENNIAEEVVCITTTTGNFVADGLCSHNCVAFMPQSTAAGVLKEAILRLFDPESPSYIGDAYFGKTPFRAPIHDSLLLEIPTRSFDLVASLVVQEMVKPIVQQPLLGPLAVLGDYLQIGVDAKTGSNWADMEELPLGNLGVGNDAIRTAAEDLEQDDLDDFGREVA